LAPGGRLLIVDFAPHGIEAMRDDYAHRRLGFERGLVEGWLRRGGFRELHYQAISPPKDGGGKLTVSLWLAVKQPAVARERHEQAETAAEGQS
ncbi:MAG TPA: ArsR family transcriptional regulator, partial [Hyphomicrobiales bacterium]